MNPSILLLSNNITFTLTDGIMIFGIFILIVLSAFFSANETAFSSVNILHIKSFADEKVKGARRAQYICEHYDFILVCLLVGNNLVNIANTTICAYLFSKFIASPTIANLLNTIVMTVVILIFGEILPKAYAKHNPEKFVLKTSNITYVFSRIIFIIAMPFFYLQKLFVKHKEEIKITEDEFETIVDTMEDQGVIDSENADIIHGAIDIGEKTVYDIFVPRVDMIAIPITATEEEVKNVFIENQFSRIPVYAEDKDNIVGVLNYKDYVIAQYETKTPDIEKIMMQPLKVSETMKVDELIKCMQKEKKHLAIVVDEYGGTSGVVTMEDALEMMVGEIYDEHDETEEIPIQKIDENKFKINPDISIDELFEFLEIEHLPETKYPSVAGMIYELSETLPQKGTVVNITAVDDVLNEHNDYVSTVAELKFTVEKVEENRIKRVTLEVNKSETISE